MAKKHWLVPLAALSAGFGVYATMIEPRWLEVKRTRINARTLPFPFNGLRIALLTDLHVGRATPLALVSKAAALVMRQRPDLIAVTGDFTTDEKPDFEGVFNALSALAAPLGVYAVPGNHDHVAGIAGWRRAASRHKNIADLTNAYVMPERLGARLCIAGIDDYYEGSPELVLPAPAERDFTILLAHTPDQAERSRRLEDGVDLMLTGHTHGGQVNLPFIGTPVSSSNYPHLYGAGIRRRPWTQVYTSRGIGTIVPIRFRSRPEVSILELSNAPRTAYN